MGPKAERSYIQSAIQSASPVGLTILLYDRLASDMRQAIAAMQNRDVEQCCDYVTHALLILGQLESGLDMEHGGETAASLSQLYQCVRVKLIEGIAQCVPQILNQQIAAILEVRQAWQQVEQQQVYGAARATAEARVAPSGPAMMFQSGNDEPQASNWTA